MVQNVINHQISDKAAQWYANPYWVDNNLLTVA